MNPKEIRDISGLSRAGFSRKYEIPIRTLEDWESGARKCPGYVENLLERCVRMDFEREIEKNESEYKDE